MKKLTMVLIGAASTVLFACATTGGGSSTEYEAAIAEAESAYKSVNSAGGAWRDTGDMIDAAKKEAGDGNYGKATSLAKEALEESKLAAQQLESQKNAGPWLF
ncbi:MAG: hypothetical protein OEZ43_11210 [Gammaproteobacteria bacterium]|nr:hypothetical protein [Gammaproteobacteria bacterium]